MSRPRGKDSSSGKALSANTRPFIILIRSAWLVQSFAESTALKEARARYYFIPLCVSKLKILGSE